MDSSVTNFNKCIPICTRIARTRTRRQLPDDCWCLIYEKLDNKSDQNAFGLTCQSFLDIERSTRKHLRPNKDYRGTHGRPSFILNMLNRSFRQLESLSLSGCIDVSDSTLTSLLNYGSKMHTLDLSFCSMLTDKGLSYVASGCPALSSITLYECCGISDYGLQTLTQSCKSLRHVDVSCCYYITDLGISYLNQNCHQLDTLRINGCYDILGESFLGFSPTFARLDASRINLDSKGVANALSGGGRRHLNISSPLMFPGWGLELAPLVLEELATNIKFLDFANCRIDEATIINISKGCPLLQEWNLSSCKKITILGWKSIGLHCKNLEILHVNNCRGLCHRGLLALGDGCTRLSILYMKNYCSIELYSRSAFEIQRPDVQIRIEKASSKNIRPPNWNFHCSI